MSNQKTYKQITNFIREVYQTPEERIPLHAPVFVGNEKKYLIECIDSTFVSYLGKFVTLFEEQMALYTGAKYAVATVNGTDALHVALMLAGTERGDEVITQPLTFVATANAIAYTGAHPVFVDVDKETLGLSDEKLKEFLSTNTEIRDGKCFNKITNRQIRACVPVHVFGHPTRIDDIKAVCEEFNIRLIEDAAESLGSKYKGQHTGTFGDIGILSFNGNKTITTGGGGMIITNNEKLAGKARHITTQAKVPHHWEYIHDEVGYNYRMPNINAAIGVAQLEKLDEYIENKRELASEYKKFFENSGIEFFTEPVNAYSNYWLNAIILKNRDERDAFLEYSNKQGVMTRPAWRLMNQLDMYKNYQCGNIENAEWLANRLVNIPSSVRSWIKKT